MTVRNQVVYEFGPVRISPSSRTLTCGDENVHIQARGFDALLLLVERRNEVVSKGELLAAIWPDIHVEESNLPVMISAIRRAIGDNGRNQKYIQTVSKFGYRFIGAVTEIGMAEAPALPGLNFDEPAIFTSEPPLVLSVQPERSLKRRHLRFSVVAGCVATALAALFLVYRLSNRPGEGHVAAASQSPAVIGETGESQRSSSRAEAEMWYQKGHYAWNLRTRDGVFRSIEYYQKAIKADPNYAPAYALLAKSYLTLPSYSEPPDSEQVNRARAVAEKAVSLDDRLSSAHTALGMVFLIVDRNFARAEVEFRRAVALDPQSSRAERELALCLIAAGRTEEAVAYARAAKAVDPISIRAATELGIVLYYGHRFPDAEREFKGVLKLNPYFYRAEVNLGQTYLSLGKFDDARRVLEEASRLSNHDPIAEGLRAEATALAGDVNGARAILADLVQRAQTSYVDPFSLAYALIGLGRLDDALVYLRKARDDHAFPAIFLKVDPSWDALHGNPNFSNLVSDIPQTATE